MRHDSNTMNKTLKKYIDVIQALNPADGFIVVDCKLKYQAISDSVAATMKSTDLLGNNLKNLSNPYAQFATQYGNFSQKIINDPKAQFRVIAKAYDNSELFLYDMHIRKIFDDSTHELVGLASFFYKLQPNFVLFELIRKSNDEVYIYIDDVTKSINPPIDFNHRERNIIWLLALSKTRKEIAGIISCLENTLISENTITTIINRNIYAKLAIHSQSAFMQKISGSPVLESISIELYNYFVQHHLV